MRSCVKGQLVILAMAILAGSAAEIYADVASEAARCIGSEQ